MIQGWHNDDYLILFEEQLEAISMTARYDAKTFLPGYTLDGLKGWDDFIVHDTAHNFYTVPTVPLIAQHLKPYTFDINLSALRLDNRLTDRIKWYVQPRCIAHLKSLSDEARAVELKSKILDAQKSILNDESRTKLLDDDDLNCWNNLDELTLEQVRFDDEATECIIEVYWQSFGGHDEDDERQLYGNATATIADDESIAFSDMSAAFEGDAPRATEQPDDENTRQRKQDEQDYTENVTKDW